MENIRKIFFGLGMLVCASQGNACTDFLISAQDGSQVVGRSLEFAEPLESQIAVHPKGENRQTKAPNNAEGLSWQSKYSYMAINALGMDMPFDGFNEKGLSFGFLWMPGSEYQKVPAEKANQAILVNDLGTWLLGNFATVDEVKQALQSIFVWGEPIPQLGNIIPPIHISLHDAQGNSAVVEFIKGNVQIYDNTVHVLTNAPTFDWQLTNLGNYLNLRALNAAEVKIGRTVIQPPGQGSGMLGIPGDWMPPSRFVRTAAFKEFAQKPKTGDGAVNLAIHLLNTVDIPFGVVEERQQGPNVDFTQWIVVKDLKRNVMYLRSYIAQSIYKFDFSKLIDTKTVLKAPIPSKAQSVNLTDTLKG